jgi:hypothetical protein
MHVEHLDCGKFVQPAPTNPKAVAHNPGASGRNRAHKVCADSGHKGYKNVCFNPMRESVKNGTQNQVIFEVLKGRFELD